MLPSRPPETCPNCGADVPRSAKACPECGSDETTGWSMGATYDGLDLPDENFDYDEFVKREFEGKTSGPRNISSFWWIVALIVLAAFVMLFAL